MALGSGKSVGTCDDSTSQTSRMPWMFLLRVVSLNCDTAPTGEQSPRFNLKAQADLLPVLSTGTLPYWISMDSLSGQGFRRSPSG